MWQSAAKPLRIFDACGTFNDYPVMGVHSSEWKRKAPN